MSDGDDRQDILICALQHEIADLKVERERLRNKLHDQSRRVLDLNHQIAQLRTEKILLESQVAVESLLRIDIPDEDPHAGSEWTGGKQS